MARITYSIGLSLFPITFGLLIGLSWGEFCTATNQSLSTIPEFVPSLNVTAVYLSENEISAIPSSAFESFPNVLLVEMDSNNISTMSDLAFQGTKIFKLSLEKNQITTFPNLTVVGGTLKRLLLSHNYITHIPELTNLTQLIVLQMQDNQIKTIDSQAFSQTPLSQLVLGSNMVKELPEMKATATTLSNVVMDNNKYIGTVISFSILKNLQHLTIKGNVIHEFPDLRNSSKTLEFLDLYLNKIVVIEEYKLEHFSALTYLNLNNNRLLTVPYSMGTLSNLKSLYLASNEIAFIPDRMFSTLHQLTYLALQRNNLSSYDGGCAPSVSTNSSGLQTLILNYNHIRIFPNISSCINSLELLKLAGNALVDIPADAFAGAIKLKEIYLERNNLTYIPDLTSASKTLNIIYLQKNQISAIPPGTFMDFSELSYILIGNNPIETIPNATFPLFPILFLRGIPLNCDCRLHWLKQEPLENLRLNDMPCAEPRILVNISWSDIKVENLTCLASTTIDTTSEVTVSRTTDGTSKLTEPWIKDESTHPSFKKEKTTTTTEIVGTRTAHIGTTFPDIINKSVQSNFETTSTISTPEDPTENPDGTTAVTPMNETGISMASIKMQENPWESLDIPDIVINSTTRKKTSVKKGLEQDPDLISILTDEFLTPVEAPMALPIGIMGIVFVCVEVIVVLLCDLFTFRTKNNKERLHSRPMKRP